MMADPLLEGNYPPKALYQALAIAAMCLEEEAATRPKIVDVVTAIEYLAKPSNDEKISSISSKNHHSGSINRSSRGNNKEL